MHRSGGSMLAESSFDGLVPFYTWASFKKKNLIW